LYSYEARSMEDCKITGILLPRSQIDAYASVNSFH
jgi:hypothetical protein